MSTATIYAHRFDAPNDEATGRIGGDEPDVPALLGVQRRHRAGVGARAGGGAHAAHAQGRAAHGDGDEPRPRRHLRRAARPRAPGARRLDRGRARSSSRGSTSATSCARCELLIDARRARRRRQPRRAEARCPSASSWRALREACGRARRAAGDEVDGRDRRVLPAHRHRARAQEPARDRPDGCARPGSRSTSPSGPPPPATSSPPARRRAGLATSGLSIRASSG